MEPLPPAPSRSVRLLLVAAGLVLLLAIVAFATRGGFGHSSHAAPSRSYANFAFTAFLILYVLGIPVAVYGFLLQAREASVKQQSFASRVLRSLLMVAVFSLAAFVVILLKRHHFHLFHGGVNPLKNLTAALRGGRAHHRSSSYEPQFEWPVLWAAVALGVVALAAALSMRRRRVQRPPSPLADPTVAEDLSATIGDAIDDLEAEPDARRAVIAAYARMEGVLGRHGLRRRPSETPVEYLRRALLGLTASGAAVRRLTSHFERAKFSSHEIDSGTKTDAIAALREIRDGLL